MATHHALLAAALEYAALGWHVFPIWPNRKVPALRGDWQEHSTVDPTAIRRWWRHRAYNIGIDVGPSGLFVIDLDTPKLDASNRAGGAATTATTATVQVNPVADCGLVADTSATDTLSATDGATEFLAVCARAGQPIPGATRVIRTPRNGWHLYFQHPTEHPLPNTKGGTGRSLGPLIDTRGPGGYVVAPPSTVDGRPYTLVRDREPAPLPSWLVDQLTRMPEPPARPVAPVRIPVTATDRRARYVRSALEREANHVRTAPPGQGNAALWGAAVALGQLVAGGGLTEDVVTDVLEQAAVDRGRDHGEALATIRSGLRRGAQRPRKVA